MSYFFDVFRVFFPRADLSYFLDLFVFFFPRADFTVSPRDAIIEAVRDSLAEAFGEGYRGSNPMVTSATKPEFGDYQARGDLYS